jgi:hypothetical protein
MVKLSRVFKVCYSNEQDNGTQGGDSSPPPPAGGIQPVPDSTKPPVDSPKFSQKDIDAIVAKRVAEEKQRASREREALLKQVGDFNLTKQEKEALEAKLEELRVASLSKEEQAKDRETKLSKKYESELKKERDERERIFNTYKEEKIEREILSAVSASDVYNPQQMADLLRSKTRLAPEVVDGKETGRLVTRIRHVLVQDGKPVEVELSPAEVVKAMRDDPERYGNQFISTATGGLGGAVGGGRPTNAGKANLADMPMDQFVKKFREDPTSVGLSRRPRGF